MTASLIAGDRDGMGARLSRIVSRPTESLKVNPKNPEKTHQEADRADRARHEDVREHCPDPRRARSSCHCRVRSPVLRRCSPRQHRPGDIVLDAFLGSGTTLIAAERVCRRCYAVEIDPLYVDTAIRRWQAYTGDTATHAVTDRTFDEISRTLGEEA